MISSRTKEFLTGVKAELPLIIGVFPFGMIYGALALKAGIPPGQAQAMSAVIFAGSSQFITTQLVDMATPGVVIILSIAVINLRHALYSASVTPYLRNLSPLWKGMLAYLLTDEAYAVTIVHYGQPGELIHKHWFFLGAGLTLWSSWQVSTAAGIFLGAIIPPGWSLDFTLALTFIAMLVPILKDRPSIAAAISAGITAILFFNFPYKLGLVAAALVGIAIGMLLEWRK